VTNEPEQRHIRGWHRASRQLLRVETLAFEFQGLPVGGQEFGERRPLSDRGNLDARVFLRRHEEIRPSEAALRNGSDVTACVVAAH